MGGWVVHIGRGVGKTRGHRGETCTPSATKGKVGCTATRTRVGVPQRGRERDAPSGEGEKRSTEDRGESIENGRAGCDPKDGGGEHRPGRGPRDDAGNNLARAAPPRGKVGCPPDAMVYTSGGGRGTRGQRGGPARPTKGRVTCTATRTRVGVLLHGRGRVNVAPPGEGEKRNAEDRDESNGTGGRGATPRTGATNTRPSRGPRYGAGIKVEKHPKRRAGCTRYVHCRGWVHLHECALTGTNQKPCVRLRFCSGSSLNYNHRQ